MAKGGYEWDENPDALDDHSAAKHAILRAYVRRYIEVLTRHQAQRSLTLTLVDGYAGGNRYTRDGLVVDGSPGIFLRTVREVEDELARARRHGFTIDARFIFVEKRRRPLDVLHETLRAGPFAGDVGKSVQILKGDFNAHAEAIIAAVKARRGGLRALFLLDQYGWGAVPFALVRRIMAELKGAEVILTFSVDSLITYLRKETAGTAAAGRVGLEERHVAELLEHKERGGRALVQHALYEHLRGEVGAPNVTPFFLRSLKSNRSLWFLHFAQSWRARDEIGQIHWEVARGFADHRGDAGLRPLGFTPERLSDLGQLTMDYAFDAGAKARTAEAMANQIPDVVDALTREAGPPTLRDIFQRHGGPTPVTLPMLKSHIGAMQAEKELIVRAPSGHVRRVGVQIDPEDRIEREEQTRFHFMSGNARR